MARKKKKEPEYVLHIFHSYSEESRIEGVAFVVRTVKEFVSFNYEILLADHVADNSITLHINGIHAPVMVMPGLGPATARRFYTDLSGEYHVVVQKLSKEINEFTVMIKKASVEVHGAPDQPFILFSTEPFPNT